MAQKLREKNESLQKELDAALAKIARLEKKLADAGLSAE